MFENCHFKKKSQSLRKIDEAVNKKNTFDMSKERKKARVISACVQYICPLKEKVHICNIQGHVLSSIEKSPLSHTRKSFHKNV